MADENRLERLSERLPEAEAARFALSRPVRRPRRRRQSGTPGRQKRAPVVRRPHPPPPSPPPLSRSPGSAGPAFLQLRGHRRDHRRQAGAGENPGSSSAKAFSKPVDEGPVPGVHKRLFVRLRRDPRARRRPDFGRFPGCPRGMRAASNDPMDHKKIEGGSRARKLRGRGVIGGAAVSFIRSAEKPTENRLMPLFGFVTPALVRLSNFLESGSSRIRAFGKSPRPREGYS